MCLGIAGRIVELVPESADLALVDVFGAKRTINIGLVENEGLAPGDWVLIHVGFAIAKMDEAEARASVEILQEIGPGRDPEPGWEEGPVAEGFGTGKKRYEP
jgi:hydrogenase expression/formation protein HypC